MAKTSGKDLFTQTMYIKTVESAANTLTFNGFGTMSPILNTAYIIHRIEYYVAEMFPYLLGAGDKILFGIALADSLASVILTDPRLFDARSVIWHSVGTPANYSLHYDPYVVDFTALPGGGRIIPADNIYLYVCGASLAGALTVVSRIFYTAIDLSAQEALEILQSYRLLQAS